MGHSSALSHFLCSEATYWAAMDSLFGRKMSICCSHLCAMLQAFNLWHICHWCHPQKRSSKPISGHKTIVSLYCTLMLLVSKLPIELNHSNQMKFIQNLCKEEPELTKGRHGVNMSLIEDDFWLHFFINQSSWLQNSWNWNYIFLCTQTNPYSAPS